MRLRVPPILLASLVALATVAALAAPASAASCKHAKSVPTTSGEIAKARTAILCLVNKERTKRDLRKLSRHPLLQKIGTSLATDMVKRHYFDHTTPDGKTFQDRLEAAGWSGTTAGENIAWGSGSLGSPAKIVSAWMHSPGHRANILGKSYRRAGVGIRAGAPEADVDGDAATYSMEYDAP
jgi:uncharacterized protein YkwD